MASRRSYFFFAAFFFEPFAFFAISNPPFRSVVDCELYAPRPAHSAAWHVGPGVGISLRGQPPTSLATFGRAQLNSKKRGAHPEHPQTRSKTYRFFAAFFFEPLAAFFAILFSSGCCDSASDGQLDRHNGWAEPSTLIPDVDYG
jgi:hypothetical protein